MKRRQSPGHGWRGSRIGLVIVFAAIGIAGCQVTNESYTPEASDARSALEQVLTQWQEGKEPEAGTSTPRFADSQQKAKKKLVSYEIVEEVPQDSGPRQFKVRLKIDKESSESTVTYFVVGKAPDFWVIRDSDYEMMSKQM